MSKQNCDGLKCALTGISVAGAAVLCCKQIANRRETKRKSSNKVKKEIKHLNKEIDEIESNLNAIIALDTTINNNLNAVSAVVTQINQKQKAKFIIQASDIGTTGFTITAPGTYELVDDVIFNPSQPINSVPVTFIDGSGVGATAFAAVSGGVVHGVFITNGGSGYTGPTTAVIGGSGTGAIAGAVTLSGGVIISVAITAGGSGYQNTVVAAITIASSNVNLILADHRLAQFGVNSDGSVASTQRPFTVGILIPDILPSSTNPNAVGLESIYISGDQSIIDGFSMYGIRVFAHTYDIQISDITLKNCGKLASLASRPFRSYLPHDSSTLPAFGPSFGVAGLSIGESTTLGMGSDFFIDTPIVLAGSTTATATATITAGSVTGFTIVNPGSGYAIPPVYVLISSPPAGGINATATVTNTQISGGTVTGITITNPGSGYLVAPTVTIAPPATLISRISAVVLEKVYCLDNFFNGLVIFSTSDITINNSHIDDTFSDDPGVLTGPTAYNVIPATGFNSNDGNFFNDPSIANMNVNDSTFNRTTLGGNLLLNPTPLTSNPGGPANNCQGATEIRSRNVHYRNCEFNSSLSTFVAGGIYGYFSGENQQTTFTNCHFDGNKAMVGSINGFHRSDLFNTLGVSTTESSRNLLLVNCTANGNQEIGDQQLPSTAIPVRSSAQRYLAGFLLSFAKNITFIDCVASDNIINGPVVGTNSVSGFYIVDPFANPVGLDGVVENIVLQGCVATRNMTFQGGQARGFAVDGGFTNPNGTGNIVVNRSILFKDCEAFGNISNIPILSNPPLSLAVTQSIGCGFLIDQTANTTFDATRNFPVSLQNCNAYRNKGAQTANTVLILPTVATQLFTAGFFVRNSLRSSLTNCEAIDNIYGFLLKNCNRCVLRDNRADNNVDLVNISPINGVGEGFTDVGPAGTPTSVGPSTSLFERNRAFANGLATAPIGANQNYNVSYITLTNALLFGTLAAFPSNGLFVPSNNISINP